MPLMTGNFSDVAERVSKKYWFDHTQTSLKVTNSGSFPVIVEVSDEVKLIPAGKSHTFIEEFKQFSIRCKTKGGDSSAFSVELDSYRAATTNQAKYLGDNTGKIKAVCVQVALGYTVEQFKNAILRAKNINNANLIHCSVSYNAAPTASVITANENNSRLPEILDYCKSIGIDTSVRVHISNSKDVNPSNKVEWFTNWKQILLDNAEIAVSHGAKYIAIENELSLMTGIDNFDAWKDINDKLKEEYPTLQTFVSLSSDEYSRGACVIDIVDIIGINLYPLMSYNGENATDEELNAAWFGTFSGTDYINIIHELKKKGKPVWVVETGCGTNSVALQDTALFQLWDTGTFSEKVQELFYKSLFKVLWKSTIDGMGLWAIGAVPASGDRTVGFTYQTRLAESIVNANWGGVS